MKKLGCLFGSKIKEITVSFTHPAYDHPIYYTTGPWHMLKQARNVLCNISILVDDQNYILNETTLKHYINYNKKKDLNVKIAAQTLSGSVADAIEFFIAIKNS